jgi:hypothetical protein
MADVTAEFRSAGFPNTYQEIYCVTSLLVAYQYYDMQGASNYVLLVFVNRIVLLSYLLTYLLTV